MVPAPKDDLLEGHHSFPTVSQPRVRIPLVSPTGLSNAMPRPKSPRHPDRKGFSTGPGLLAAEHFHNTSSEKHQVPPLVTDESQARGTDERQARGRRTRSRDRIGRFQEGCNPDIIVPERLQTCTARSARHSREFAKKMGPVAQDGLRGCVRGTVRESIYVAGRMTECLAFTSDIYQQECTNNHRHRGDDSMFFVSAEARNFARRAESLDDPDDNSMAMSGSDDYEYPIKGKSTRSRASSVRKGRSPSPTGRETPRKDNYSNRKSKSLGGFRKSKSPTGKRRVTIRESESDYGNPREVAEGSASPSRSSISPPRKNRVAFSDSDTGHPSELTESTFTPMRKSRSPISMRKSPIQKNEYVRTPPRVAEPDEDAPYRSNKGLRYPEAPKIMDDCYVTDPPTPERDNLRRPRGAYDQDDSLEFLKEPLPTMRRPGTEYMDLRDIRMHMLNKDKNNEKVTEGPISRSLEELKIHDGSMKTLETELKETKNILEQTRHELTLTRKASAQQKQVGTATAEKLFGDRVDIEEKLRREMRENDNLLEQISGLRNEKDRLRTTLDVGLDGQVEGTRLPDQTLGSTVSLSPSRKAQNPQCPATQEGLQESADRSMYLSSLVISLRAEILELKSELAEARAAQLAAKQSQREIEDDCLRVKAEGEKLKDQVEQLKQEIEVLEQQASEKERDGELEIHKLQAEIRCMQDKLVTTAQDVLGRSADHQRTEKVLNETQDEATKLREQVSSLISKVESLEAQSDDRNKVSGVEAKKLQGEISALNEKLSKSHLEIIDQAAEHLKERKRMEEALSQSRQEAHVLQSKVITLDDQVAAAEDEANRMRMQMDDDDRASRVTDASRSSQIVRYMNRKMANADSSVMELFRAKDMATTPDSSFHTN
jgi:hypothetical protein